MGESVISSGELYINGELFNGELFNGEKIEVVAEPETEIYNIFGEEISIEIKIDHKKWRKLLGYISQKRFRKLLYSIGYQRNQVNEIIEVMWNWNKSYRIRDAEYWKEYLIKD